MTPPNMEMATAPNDDNDGPSDAQLAAALNFGHRLAPPLLEPLPAEEEEERVEEAEEEEPALIEPLPAEEEEERAEEAGEEEERVPVPPNPLFKAAVRRRSCLAQNPRYASGPSAPKKTKAKTKHPAAIEKTPGPPAA